MAELITITDLQEVCGLNRQVEARKIDPWILSARLRFEKILGRTLYGLLVASPSDTRFVDLMAQDKGWGKDYLCWTALGLAYTSLYAEADRAGVYKKTGGDYEAAEKSVLNELRAQAMAEAEAREERLMAYLKDNAAVYSELSTTVGTEERITERNTKGVGGLSLRRYATQQLYRG